MPRAALLAVIVTLGCAHTRPHPTADPAPLLNAWAQAIAADQPAAGWKLLSAALRARGNENDFALAWHAAAADLAAQAPWLGKAWTLRRASAELPDGRALPLTRDGNLWRIAAARPQSVGGDTPEDALRRLIAAAEARDFDAVLGLLGEPLRATVESALADRLEHLKAALHKGALEISGNPTRIRYDARYHIDLVQENGRWRIADFN
jgi:hypothetical protein